MESALKGFNFLPQINFVLVNAPLKIATKQSPAMAYGIVQIFGASGLEFSDLKLVL